MSSTSIPVDVKSAEDHLMRFLAVEGLSGQEKAIGEVVIAELKKVGVPASAIRFDKVNERIPVPTQTGNLFVDLPGTRKGPRLLFITHLDTVTLCAGAKPKREGDRIVSDGTAAEAVWRIGRRPGSAPASRSARTVAREPEQTAWCSGVPCAYKSALGRLTSAPAPIIHITASAFPFSAARTRANCFSDSLVIGASRPASSHRPRQTAEASVSVSAKSGRTRRTAPSPVFAGERGGGKIPGTTRPAGASPRKSRTSGARSGQPPP